jgi:hypothetical protein
VVGPSFTAAEVPDVIEAVLATFRALRKPGEFFIDALRRIGHDPFKQAANARATPRPKKPWHKIDSDSQNTMKIIAASAVTCKR